MELVKSVYDTLEAMSKPRDLSKYAAHVRDWNSVAGRARNGKFTTLEKQMEFVEEELKETLTALKDNDKVEVIDGACDFFVVASYALWLNKSNASNEIYSGISQDFSPGVALDALHKGDVETLARQSVALLFTLDFNLDYNMMQVLTSNDSKYPRLKSVCELYEGVSNKEACRLECQAIEKRSKGRYEGVYATFVEDLPTPDIAGPRVVFFDKGGKIMKPSTFVEPKIIV